jgi:hypothetical protein
MILATTKPASEVELQYTTFFVDGLLMGVPTLSVLLHRKLRRHRQMSIGRMSGFTRVSTRRKTRSS